MLVIYWENYIYNKKMASQQLALFMHFLTVIVYLKRTL